MKLATPKNSNYAAVVCRIHVLNELDNCDNVVSTPLIGFAAIVGKADTHVGDLGIVFPAETQLSEEYTKINNLYRHADLNSNPQAAGYLEDNRRVKAMKFRGNRSDCLFMPLSSLAYTGAKLNELQEGDIFDNLNGHEICRKYYVKTKGGIPRIEKNKQKKFNRIDKKFLPEHYDTDNYFRNAHHIPADRWVSVTQKAHGSSVRFGWVPVQRQLNRREKIARKFGVKVSTSEIAFVCGSRKVIKDPTNPNQQHYYDYDLWTEESMRYKDQIPENYIVYGELIGWTKSGAPIQTSYTYDVPQGQCELYVYRVAFVNGQGKIVDLAWDQVMEFCRDSGFKHVPELWSGYHRDFKADDWLDIRYYPTFPQAIPLGANNKIVDEGVVIRIDGLVPYTLKAKSPAFLVHESKLLDKGEVDLETIGSEENA